MIQNLHGERYVIKAQVLNETYINGYNIQKLKKFSQIKQIKSALI